MSRLRVLHVGKFYPPISGGIEKVVQVLCEGERPHADSRALVAHTKARTEHNIIRDVPVTRVGSLKKVGAVALCPSFPYWMQRLQGDVMVIHEPNPVALVAHAVVQPKSPLVFWVHAEVVRPEWRYNIFYRPFLRRLLRLADRIVVASPPIAEHAAELQPYRQKCVVIPYAIDPDQHALTPALSARVAEIREARPEPLALFVGRMVPYKGGDVLLRALVHAPVRAVFVGDGPLRGEWEALARSLGLADRVVFAGEASSVELAALYNACDMFVLPSVTRAEAFGVVQLEAMACRKPVISTALEASGVAWVNRHGQTGLVVPPSDADQLCAAMTTLATQPALRTELGHAGRQRVIAEFSIARMVAQTTSLYRSVQSDRA